MGFITDKIDLDILKEYSSVGTNNITLFISELTHHQIRLIHHMTNAPSKQIYRHYIR